MLQLLDESCVADMVEFGCLEACPRHHKLEQNPQAPNSSRRCPHEASLLEPGLLGPNGAGKTTTLGILTGEIRPATLRPSGSLFSLAARNPSAGNVSIFGHNMAHQKVPCCGNFREKLHEIGMMFGLSSCKERLAAFSMLGVCPQVDPLWAPLAVVEVARCLCLKKTICKAPIGICRPWPLEVCMNASPRYAGAE